MERDQAAAMDRSDEVSCFARYRKMLLLVGSICAWEMSMKQHEATPLGVHM